MLGLMPWLVAIAPAWNKSPGMRAAAAVAMVPPPPTAGSWPRPAGPAVQAMRGGAGMVSGMPPADEATMISMGLEG